MRRVRDKAFAEFLDRCRTALAALPAEPAADSFVLLYRILVLLRSGLATPGSLKGGYASLEAEVKRVYQTTHLSLFSDNCRIEVSDEALRAALDALGHEGGDGLPDVYFASFPISWLGKAYQALIGRAERKKAGVYFTPDYLVRYVVEGTVEVLLGGPNGQRLLFETPETVEDIRLIDPSMGGGDFLVQAVETLAARWIECGVRNAECGIETRGRGDAETRRWGNGDNVTCGLTKNLDTDAPTRALFLDSRLRGNDISLHHSIQPSPHLSGSGERFSEIRNPKSEIGTARVVVASKCVYGLDLDPVAVEVSRASLALLVGLENGPFDYLERNLRVGDTLLGCVDGVCENKEKGESWSACFPEVCGNGREQSGFDAVVGNPPYVAAKNGELASYGKQLGEDGQSDSYLMFVKHVAESGLLRNGGVFSMVLPDPVLARGNAKRVRDVLFTRWTPVSILHVAGAFRDAVVANAIPICRNVRSSARTFRVARISHLSDRHAFASAPNQVFRRKAFTVDRELVDVQPGKEVMYLADVDFRRNVLAKIHGERCCLSDYRSQFAPLAEMGVERIFRGEEVGKARALSESANGGSFPMLLGGQSISRYRINWEGARLAEIRKPLEWYHGRKIVIQKSAPRIVAALDDSGGFIVPQSVYCIKPGNLAAFYLLTILNSSLMKDYVFRVFTGYKMLQPQLELEDIKRLPIRVIEHRTSETERKPLVDEGQSIINPALRSGRLDEDALTTFVERRLNRIPEQADVLHDLLVRLGKGMTALASENPSTAVEMDAYELRFSAVERAIDIIVSRLYGVPLSYTLSQQ